MGDVADMMLDGTLCEGCGVYLGEAVDYPRRCKSCQKDQRVDALRTATHQHHREQKTPCPTCGRRVKIVGLADHMRDSHGVRPNDRVEGRDAASSRSVPWRPKAGTNLSGGLEGMFNEEPTDEQLADACMWQRHDFGLLDDENKRLVMFIMREHWRAIWKACNTPGRGAEFMPSN